jgi:glycosyltransferase involved in cell wall biosynthesis
MLEISVIVPTYNEEKNIERCLKALCNQTFPRKKYEIIVVDGQSKDRTVKIAKKYARVVQQKSWGVGGARNDGVKLAKGKIIATTDADTVVPENWLERIEKNFRERSIVAVFGPLLPMKKKGLYEFAFWIGNLLLYLSSRSELHHNICGANAAFKKQAFLKVGGFKNLPVCDDVEISIPLKKIGRVYFDKKMAVKYSTRRLEKFGLLETVHVWLTNLRRLLQNKIDYSFDSSYIRQEY